MWDTLTNSQKINFMEFWSLWSTTDTFGRKISC